MKAFHKKKYLAESLTARFAALLCTFLFTTVALCDDEEPKLADPQLSAQFLEAHHAVIGEIIIENSNIFNPEIPGEDRYLYRLANRLHVRTQPKIIRRQLLFKTGEPFEQRLLDESERILRATQYLQEAVIEPVHFEDGVVDIHVHTTDVWTLDPRFSFGRAGGENNTTIGIKDSNLLGTGIYFGLFVKSTVDRDSNEIVVSDDQLGNTWFGLAASYADNSDGKKAYFSFARPFYELDSRRSSGIALLSEERVDSLYDRGEIQAQFEHQIDRYEIFAGISKGLKNGWVNRWTTGLVYDEHRFNPYTEGDPTPYTVLPHDRKFVYPYLQWERLEDRYEETRRHDQIGVTEDRFLGTRLALRLGYASTALGSLDDAFILDGSLSMGWGTSETDSLLANADYHSRIESGNLRDELFTFGVVYHHRHSDRWLLHLALEGANGSNLDMDNQLLLGGDNGLRGYPLRYQGGESRLLFTAEERLFTDWYPFRLIHVGGAIFFDAGRTWESGGPINAENLGWLKDVGFGFRFGNSRSGIGRVVHLDFAFPLDGDSSIDNLQVLFKGKTSF